ncbi:hypothetical protein DFH29DRAFT_1010631 [Suillus ampliporus]|nr:hypothetical protein DFH29DRAFT_1010631 [Suillus ampliporus]
MTGQSWLQYLELGFLDLFRENIRGLASGGLAGDPSNGSSAAVSSHLVPPEDVYWESTASQLRRPQLLSLTTFSKSLLWGGIVYCLPWNGRRVMSQCPTPQRGRTYPSWNFQKDLTALTTRLARGPMSRFYPFPLDILPPLSPRPSSGSASFCMLDGTVFPSLSDLLPPAVELKHEHTQQFSWRLLPEIQQFHGLLPVYSEMAPEAFIR